MSEPFRVAVSQPVLDDLARRLELARWPEGFVLDGGEDAARLGRIARLLERWRGGYEWREHEAGINEHDQELVNGLHVLKAGRGPRLVLMNGWPSTLAEYCRRCRCSPTSRCGSSAASATMLSEHGLDQPGDDEHAATLVGRVSAPARDTLGCRRADLAKDDPAARRTEPGACRRAT